MNRQRVFRLTFILAGIALASLIINVFLWYGASRPNDPPFLPVSHRRCGEPVALRAEDYNWLGGSRPGDDMEIARLDFCDPVRVKRRDGTERVWFWLEVEATGQVFPYAGWGFPWVDAVTPFPADFRESRNPWWTPRTAIRAVPNQLGYPGADGGSCPQDETLARGVDLFFYREEGFQLPVGMTHSGWVCLYFDPAYGLPDAFTVTISPDRARITQWVDRLYVIRDSPTAPGPPIPDIPERTFCDFVRETHPDSIRAGEACDTSSG
ncbi:MAG: hypothetical protein JW966_13155 [Anaerolineae bacterium]|nr:hypothetical protein [Anaerolineae bacterium]